MLWMKIGNLRSIIIPCAWNKLESFCELLAHSIETRRRTRGIFIEIEVLLPLPVLFVCECYKRGYEEKEIPASVFLFGWRKGFLGNFITLKFHLIKFQFTVSCGFIKKRINNFCSTWRGSTWSLWFYFPKLLSTISWRISIPRIHPKLMVNNSQSD